MLQPTAIATARAARLAGGAVLLLACALLAAAPARGQYLFGKNKVIYSDRSWRIARGERVEIFYYAGEEHLARLAQAFADSAAAEFEVLFRVTPREPVPLVVYGTQHDFRETNVIPSIIPESVGGFTDLIRGRVVVPSTGSLYALRHVIRHELVHAFMLEKLAQEMHSRRKFSYQYPPLWFVEGLAEYYSAGDPDTEGQMLLRESVLEGTLPPLREIWRVQGSYLMYKMGQSLVAFLERNYSREAVLGLLESWWRGQSLEALLRESLGMDFAQLDARWRASLRRRHYPAAGSRSAPAEIGRPMAEGHGFQTAPASLDDGRFVFLDSSSGRVDLVRGVAPAAGGKPSRPERLVAGGRDAKREAIPMLRSRLSARAGRVALTVRNGPRDELLIVSAQTGAVLDRFAADSLVQIESPALGPGGRLLVSGIDRSGRRDLYLLEKAGRWRATRLTRDDYDDRDPAWHPDGQSLLFVSDRGFPPASPYRNLFRLELGGGRLERLSRGDWVDRQPVWNDDGLRYLFVSDRLGAWDLYLAEGDRQARLTACYGAVQDPAWHGDGVLASVYEDGAYRLYRFPLAAGGPETVQAPEPAGSLWAQGGDASDGDLPSSLPYRRRWGLDFVQSGLAYDPEFGSGGGAQAGFTDLLGNHQLSVALANTAQSGNDFFKRMNLGIAYSNLAHRWNWSVALFHLTSDFDDNWQAYRFERRFGGLVALRYPFNTFRRIELSANLRGIIQEDELSAGLRDPEAVLGSVYAAWVHDTVLWGFGGPYDGERVNLTVGLSSDFGAHSYGYTVLRADARRYWRLSRQSVYAARIATHWSAGDDPRFVHLGGPIELRGWPYHHFHSRGLVLLNQELRFPLLDGIRFLAPPGGLDLPPIRGSVFVDTAYLFYRYYSIPQPQWAGALGVGLELGFGPPIVLRWNLSRRTDFETISRKTEHQVFLGWNF